MTEPIVPPQGRATTFRRILAAVAATVGIGAAVVIGLRDRGDFFLSLSTPRTPPAAAPVAHDPPSPQGIAPSFDVVRVGPQGNAVIAGRAAPGAEVRIEDGGREIGRAQADAHGDWVFVPTEPLAPGGRELALAARSPDGREARSAGSVLLSVPERPSSEAPVAVLSRPEAPPLVLQGAPGDGKPLGLDAAEREADGALRLAGRAPPGTTVRVYLDDKPVGDARADDAGRWTLSPPAPVTAGDHQVRLDQLAGDGRVAARALAPLPGGEASRLAGGQVVVRHGQSLWRLAREAYGSGARFTVLYQANRQEIRDPDRIYPGQTFAVPALAPR